MAKLRRVYPKKAGERTDRKLFECVVWGMIGPFRTPSLGGVASRMAQRIRALYTRLLTLRLLHLFGTEGGGACYFSLMRLLC